jgi:hypothetical protein
MGEEKRNRDGRMRRIQVYEAEIHDVRTHKNSSAAVDPRNWK